MQSPAHQERPVSLLERTFGVCRERAGRWLHPWRGNVPQPRHWHAPWLETRRKL